MKSRRTLFAALAATAILILAAWLAPRDTAGAWLFGFILVAGMPIGALTLKLIGRLTGGAWCAALGPSLAGLARCTPVVAFGAIPVLAGARLLYPWAADGAHDPSVGALYLNVPLVVLRTVVAFCGWTLLAWDLTPAEGSRGQLAAGLGLVFHVIMTTFVAYDWLLALTPGFTSSAFGAETIIAWMLGALALTTIVTPSLPRGISGDIAGLTAAMIMGAGYMVFFQFLIIWYGDLPETVQFYLVRGGAAGIAAISASLVVGLVIPMLCLAFESVRRSHERLRMVAAMVLGGIVLYRIWFILPLFGYGAWLLAPFATGLLAAALRLTLPWVRSPAHSTGEDVRHG